MKGVDIFCASQASTAIRLSHTMEIEDEPYASCSSSPASSTAAAAAAIFGGGISSGRAIDRHNPIIRDPRRLGKSIPYSSCSSQSPGEVISPKPLLQSQKKIAEKNSSPEPKKENPDDDDYVIATDLIKNRRKKKKKEVSAEAPKQGYEEKGKVISPEIGPIFPNRNHGTVRKSWSCTRAATPVGSSRYLLSSDQNQTSFLNLISDFDPVLSLEAEESPKPNSPFSAAADGGAAQPKPEPAAAWDAKSPPSTGSPESPQNQQQVVVLRVSLHCRGCERKMKKHISRMEGVSSFNIDFAAKKLTVVGNVTPLAVLASVSKVKNAQLLPPVAAQPNPYSGMEKNYLNQLPINTTIVSL